MKEHIKRWKWLYIFYLLAVINYFVTSTGIKLGLIGVMVITMIMFYRSTIERLYNNR